MLRRFAVAGFAPDQTRDQHTDWDVKVEIQKRSTDVNRSVPREPHYLHWPLNILGNGKVTKNL
jgi:hypothetical protein